MGYGVWVPVKAQERKSLTLALCGSSASRQLHDTVLHVQSDTGTGGEGNRGPLQLHACMPRSKQT